LKSIFTIQDKLYRFALRITGNAFEAEDVVQEVCIKVWEKQEQMKDVKNEEAWYMTLTRNAALDKIKSKHHKSESTDTLYFYKSSESDPYEATQQQDTIDNIRQLMQQLPEKQRMTMHLRDIEDHSYDEIAQILNISLEQVKSNLFRARTTIRKLINEL
jgi:RNA polymerase sigma factor (sigma-70 family)